VKKVTLLCALAISGCQSDAQNTGGAAQHWKPALNAYVACNYHRSKSAAAQPGDPLSLGIAVTRMCAAEKQAFWDVVNTWDGPVVATRMADRLEQDQGPTNAAIIVKARS